MTYLSYPEYMARNGTADTVAFERNIDRACAIIDRETKNRIAGMSEIPEKAKLACRDVVDCLIKSEQSGDVASRSQSAGGVSESITYTSGSDINDEIDTIIEDYLLWETDDNGTCLLSRGAV